MRIKVNDEFLDSFSDEVIAQTYSVNQLGSIETRQGGFSNDFVLPLTGRNRELLEIPDDINSSSRAPYTKFDVELFDGGATIATGYLKFKVVSSLVIQVSFFSDNVEWFSLIKDRKLVDIDLSAYDHVWNYTNIATAINEDKETGYTYPLIDYGEFELSTDLSADTEQMYPAMFVSTLVKQLLYDVGWKIQGEVVDHPLYKRMIIPFSGKSFSHTQEWVTDNTISVDKDLTQVASYPSEEITWDGVNTDIEVTGESGEYTITALVNLQISGGDDAAIQIKNNGNVIKTLGFISGPFDQVINVNVVTNLENGDIITVVVVLLTAGDTAQITADDSSISLVPNKAVKRGSTIQISQILPDMKQSDLLGYIAFTFGVIPQANNYSKTITFSFFKSVKNNLVNSDDWSNKIDLSVDPEIDFTELLNNYGSISIFNYKEDSNDDELKAYEAEIGRRFGQGQFDIDNEFISKEVTVYEAPFSPMININSFNNQIYIPQIRFKEPGSNDLTPAPKIAILSENISVSILTNGLFDRLRIYDDTDEYETNYEDMTSIPFCWFAKTQYVPEVDALLDSLAFDQVSFPNAIGTPLIDRFLSDYEDMLNSVKYLKARFHLNEVDIANLDFTIPVYVDKFKTYFFKSKIENYQGSKMTTPCELVKIV